MSCELCKHDIPVLKDRLAQAEHGELKAQVDAEGLRRKLAQAERERNELKAKHCVRATEEDRLRRVAMKLTAERDAALARAEEQAACANIVETRLRADLAFWYAKAEAAEKRASVWEKNHTGLLSHHNDLRTRIEALIEEYVRWEGELPVLPRIRALLSPPEEETALDVLSELEGIARKSAGSLAMYDVMAKLRKLLEKEGK